MRAQAFFMDALLGLALAIITMMAVASTTSSQPSPMPSLMASAACYDLANYIYSDEEFYANITSGLKSEARITNTSLQLLKGRLRYYGEALGLSSVDFSLVGTQNEHIQISSRVATASEKCCFPLPVDRGKRVLTACLAVNA